MTTWTFHSLIKADPIEIRTILFNALCEDGQVYVGNVDKDFEEEDLADLVIDGRVNLTALATAVADHVNKGMTP